MLIENITKNILSSAEPAITKLRSWLFFVFVLYNSPLVDNLYSPLIFNDSIINALKTLADVTQATALIYYFSGAISIYFLLPYMHYYICRAFSKLQISSAQSLISVSENLSRKSDADLKTILIEKFDDFELEAKTALSDIDGVIRYLEALTITIIIYIFFIFKLKISIFFLPLFALIWVGLMLFSIRKITLKYLEEILPYKVLAARYNSVFTESKESNNKS